MKKIWIVLEQNLKPNNERPNVKIVKCCSSKEKADTTLAKLIDEEWEKNYYQSTIDYKMKCMSLI